MWSRMASVAAGQIRIEEIGIQNFSLINVTHVGVIGKVADATHEVLLGRDMAPAECTR